MDSIEDMFLKLLVRGMNPSGHFGAFKCLLFYSQIIFTQKKQKTATPSRFQMQACHASCQQDSWAQALLPRVGGLRRQTCPRHHPLPSPVSPSCQPSCVNRAMSSLQPWLAWVRGKPGQPIFTPPLLMSLKVSIRCSQASPQPHEAGWWVRFCPASQAKRFVLYSLVSYLQRRNEDTRLHASALRSATWHCCFQRRWSVLKFHLTALKSVAVLPLPS